MCQVINGRNSKLRTAVATIMVLTLFLVNVFPTCSQDINGKWLPALHTRCLRCICEGVSGCNKTLACSGGYCGAFGISRIYWVEAGRPVLPLDEPERLMAFEDCANMYSCAERIVKAYITKLAKDCNGDGNVNCDDFAMMHHNGGYICNKPLDRSQNSRDYLKRYEQCKGYSNGVSNDAFRWNELRGDDNYMENSVKKRVL